MSLFPVVSHASGRYLLDSNGQPFPILGRTAWGLQTISPTDRAIFLDDTVAKGFTAVEFQIPGHLPNIFNNPLDGGGNLPFNSRLDTTSWDGTFSGSLPDMTTPNSSFWSFADGVISDCLSRNLLALKFPAYLGIGGSEGWKDVMTANGSTKTQAYGAFVANRYKPQPNIVWMTAGDTGSGFTEELDLITGLKSVTGQQSLHFSAERQGGSVSTDGTGVLGTTMTLNGAYGWPDAIAMCRKAYTHGGIPAFLLEEPYDQEGPDGNNINTIATQPVRRWEWWGTLETIGGYVAGNGYIWRFAPSGTLPDSDNWKSHLNTRGAQDLAILNSFWKSVNWWTLVPSGQASMRTLIPSGSGIVDSDTYISAACASDGSFMLAYRPPGHSGGFTADLRSLDVAGRGIRGRWLNPTTGAFSTNASAAGTFTLSNTASAQSFTPPSATTVDGFTDTVLVLDTQSPSIPTGITYWCG